MGVKIALVVAALATATAATAGPRDMPRIPDSIQRQCDISSCAAGTMVVTGPRSAGVYMGCATAALSDYTNFVLGLIAIHETMAGTMPNIDPVTGEPISQGETAQMVDSLRRAADVATFDQAATKCFLGPHNHRLKVINYVKDRQSTWVYDETKRASYWLPTVWISLPPAASAKRH